MRKTIRLRSIHRDSSSHEAGVSLLETVIVLFVLGAIAVIFLTGMTISSKAAFTTDEQATAENLARSQTEWALNATYAPEATSYSSAPILTGKDYSGYSANIIAKPLHSPDDGIQKITVTVSHSGKQVFTMESYKVDR